MRYGLLAVLALSAMAAACSSVTPMSDSGKAAPLDAKCPLDVYLTYQSATQSGPIEELCVVSGTSSGSFSHTVETAIEKHKHKACACGATGVYIQSSNRSGFSVAAVTMVGFRRSGGSPDSR